MTRTYSTPAAFKQALEDRLKADARKRSVDVARLRQLLVFDRFLARVAPAFEDALVLKGGLVLELRLERARTTRDIDFSITGNPREVARRLQNAAQEDLGDFLKFDLVADRALRAEGMKYEGQRYRATARLAGMPYAAPFGVDIAFAEPLYGHPDLHVGHDWLKFAKIAPAKVLMYPVETHVAEKLHAYTLPRPRPNSRLKDLPDVALLGSVAALKADALRTAIEGTFTHRGTHPVPASFPPPSAAWEAPYRRMAQLNGLPWATLELVASAAGSFLNPVLSAEAVVTWKPATWSWTTKR